MRAILLLLTGLLTLSLSAALPPAAEALKAKRDAQVAKIDAIYGTELAKLQKKAMAEGNLTGANEIEKEIARATPDPFGVPRLEGKWRVNDKVTRSFFGDMMIDEGGNKHSWIYDKGVITIQIGRSWEKLNYDPKTPELLKGENNNGIAHIYKRL